MRSKYDSVPSYENTLNYKVTANPDSHSESSRANFFEIFFDVHILDGKRNITIWL